MNRTLEKRERSLGIKLSLKGDRCSSPKCALTRKPYRPGQHGKKLHKLSEFGVQLREKQKMRFSYGITEKQLEKVFKEAEKKTGVTADGMMDILESRLDNVMFRLGIAPSRTSAKQLVGHGHFTVNGRKVTIPSYRVRIGDKISIRPESKDHPSFENLTDRLKNYEAPTWLGLDKNILEGTVIGKPAEVPQPFDINMVVDYYS
ncbi:MAG: 30S ribosomal protein S4 [Parcubacteria group bacterium CG1_02_42_13]|uniref:Small ribosomal subunit protein uS4 n=1 Tax=Candidatus Colwellbacteria bacterium CG23_combo_of_CG06-09_8_20_14_all_42_19 TaxID=1974541 RepID=A0A2H0ALC2_9BACT|nr:MAG: 30S ribosomal protein S4 [Parcubacteria group bacterium CG1_02_42_13]PIP46187.1 MAG: 30S ribosomal protein S4 [Candidatus Colwellbacteria bacterium CG23_combo_of_CG06-09_8_20_14_all_42_19]